MAWRYKKRVALRCDATGKDEGNVIVIEQKNVTQNADLWPR